MPPVITRSETMAGIEFSVSHSEFPVPLHTAGNTLAHPALPEEIGSNLDLVVRRVVHY
jgi:hypothetical protein